MKRKFKTGDKIRLLDKPIDWYNSVDASPGMSSHMFKMTSGKIVTAIVDAGEVWNNWIYIEEDKRRMYSWSEEWFEFAGPSTPITNEEFIKCLQ